MWLAVIRTQAHESALPVKDHKGNNKSWIKDDTEIVARDI